MQPLMVEAKAPPQSSSTWEFGRRGPILPSLQFRKKTCPPGERPAFMPSLARKSLFHPSSAVLGPSSCVLQGTRKDNSTAHFAQQHVLTRMPRKYGGLESTYAEMLTPITEEHSWRCVGRSFVGVHHQDKARLDRG